MKILTVSQMQKAERDCATLGISVDMLMESAGRAVAEETRRILREVRDNNILVLVGPGNNGGDGLVAARHLHDWGAKVTVYLCGQRPEGDANLEKVLKRGIICLQAADDNIQSKLNELLLTANAVIDAIFGTGQVRPLASVFSATLNSLKQAKQKHPDLRVIALDLPSGLNADTGAVDEATPFADDTITLGYPKVGLFHFPGAERAGRLTVVDIGIPAHLVEYVTTELITDKWAKSVLPRRPLVANKGTFGKMLVMAGSINYIGAAYLACGGAMRVGAGLTTLATAASLQPILAAKLTETTYLPLPEDQPGLISTKAAGLLFQQLEQYDVLLMGCGLGQSESTTEFVKTVLFGSAKKPPLVLDADGLNALAKVPNWWNRFRDNAILTPHPGEMARLAGKSIDEIQSSRIETARAFAAQWHKTVVLKGAYTVIAAPDGRVAISPIANPGLASAGTGDVLAGTIAGLLAQGLNLFDAAACGVYLHGKASELVRAELGDAGMVASDLLLKLPLAIRQLKAN